jgi:hypothetical protein
MNLSWLMYLLCPLMMILMVFMMMKRKDNDPVNYDHQKHLVEELNALKKQNEIIQKELREFKDKS